jgi:hypothetical protein
MKKIAASMLVLMFATSAFAANNVFVAEALHTSAYGGEYTEPCNTTPDTPVPANGYCSEGMTCPVGYDPVAKMCWDGHWFSQCGTTCKNNNIYKGQ